MQRCKVVTLDYFNILTVYFSFFRSLSLINFETRLIEECERQREFLVSMRYFSSIYSFQLNWLSEKVNATNEMRIEECIFFITLYFEWLQSNSVPTFTYGNPSVNLISTNLPRNRFSLSNVMIFSFLLLFEPFHLSHLIWFHTLLSIILFVLLIRSVDCIFYYN